MSWGQLKDIVFKAVDGFLTEPRERYRALMADRRQVDRILAAGAEKARLEAQHLLARVRDAIGRVEMRP